MDIISSLPDPIICHVLSFLPIHFSVTTSVLARRWRYLWTYVRHLHLSDLTYYDECWTEDKIDFSDMVDSVLSRHNGSLDSLIICSDLETYFPDVRLPHCCFKFSTLVKLTLQKCTISVQPGAVCLPRLIELHLHCNYYENDESLPNLVSGCSALEDLHIERTFCGDMACCYVRSPTLKSLVLWFELSCYTPNHNDEHKLVLDIPAVQYLEMRDNFSQIILAEKLSSLAVADIWFSSAFHSQENISRWWDAFQFVEKLSNANSLTFTSSARMKRLNQTFSFATTRFHNLTKLEFEADWHFLTELLECAYKLESLTIGEMFPIPRKHASVNELKCWREPKHLPECLLSSLKYVSIYGYAGGEHELNMVSYIMMHAKVLKSVRIDTESGFHCEDANSKLNLLQRISYLPRGSHECRLTFI